MTSTAQTDRTAECPTGSQEQRSTFSDTQHVADSASSARNLLSEAELARAHARLDLIDTRLDSINARLERIETRLDSIERRLDDLAKSQAAQTRRSIAFTIAGALAILIVLGGFGHAQYSSLREDLQTMQEQTRTWQDTARKSLEEAVLRQQAVSDRTRTECENASSRTENLLSDPAGSASESQSLPSAQEALRRQH